MAKPNIVQALKIHNDLRKETAIKILRYNRKTGIFTWKNRPDINPAVNSRIRGKRAGSINTYGHRQIRIKGKFYVAHRLAWLIVKGRWPKELLDHKNNKPDDNRWKNIRPASKNQNGHNRKTNKNNRAKKKGVRSRPEGNFQASIQINKKQQHLGTFLTAKAAHAAYKIAAKKLHKNFARF